MIYNNLQNRLEYILFLGFSKFFCFIGIDAARRFAPLLAHFFFYLVPIRKKTVLDNLTMCFPEYNAAKIKIIAYNSYKSFCITFIEILCMPSLNKEQISKMVNFTNIKIVKEKYKEGKGVILMSAHFGNWEFAAASAAASLNIPFQIIIKEQRNHYVTDWMNRARTKWGNGIVPLGISVRNILKTILDKNVVAMVADQRGPSEGIRVNFFGKPAAIYSGPAMLALKTKAPLLMSIPVRQKDFSYKAIVEEIPVDDLPGDNEAKIVELSQRHTDYLEKYIRQYPEQWLWMHKRWKY